MKTDIDDSPKDPSAPLQSGSLSSRAKPWQTPSIAPIPIELKFKKDSEEDDGLPKNIGSTKTDEGETSGSDVELSDIELN